MGVENCDNCAFAVAYDGYNLACHRHAPTAPVQSVGLSGSTEIFRPATHWPKVRRDDFCGDFELKG
jgi:hypothetical protein